MTDFTITYENNIFYCTKNNTKWISVDGEKWYGEEKRITELERKNRLLGERCNQLLKDKGDLTDQIADIKANCDLAIEGRDVKIMELEKENNKLLDVINNQDVKIADLEKSVNNWLKYEKETQYHKSIIKDLKKENKILEGCLLAEQEHTQILEQQIEKMKCCENCKFWDNGGWEGYCKLSQYKKPCEDWELKE